MKKLVQSYSKPLSFALKTIIVICSLVYIYSEIAKTLSNPEMNQIDFTSIVNMDFILLITASLFLVIVNWSLEALKWKILIQKYELISFFDAFKGVITGVTFGIFTPNRLGEVGGRIFYLKKADRIKAALVSFIGGAAQLFATIFAGLLAMYFFMEQYSAELPKFVLGICMIAFLLSVFLFLMYLFPGFLNKISTSYLPQLKKYSEAFRYYTTEKLLLIFALSAVRYFVFALQFVLVLWAFNFQAEFAQMLIMVALTYLISTLIPTFAFTEIATRGSAAVYFFSFLDDNSIIIFISSFVLWLMNLAIPSLIGIGFMSGVKFNR
jgi:uncharacterized membrane protein YbhN (UPF0104 family)